MQSVSERTSRMTDLSRADFDRLLRSGKVFEQYAQMKHELEEIKSRVDHTQHGAPLATAGSNVLVPTCAKCGDTGYVHDWDGMEDNCACGALQRIAAGSNTQVPPTDRRSLSRRLGVMADVLVHTSRRPTQAFKDEIVLLLREAERWILEQR